MTYESMTLTSEGVKKQTFFQERFIRDKNVVWSERIVPNAAPHNHQDSNEHEHEHEHELNFATAGKWISKDANNQIKFAFVRSQEKKIIQPRASEYGTLGFNGEWETAYYLVNRASLQKMTKAKPGNLPGTYWFEEKSKTLQTKILWDETRELLLTIETSRLDGTMSNKITLAIVAPPRELPWTRLSQYQTVAYEDLLD